MDAETSKALEGSIAKWDRGVVVDDGSGNCDLCKMFLARDCGGCPVAIKIGQEYCEGTPYKAWRRHHRKIHQRQYIPVETVPGCPTCIRLQKKEADFLKSLREVK